jgi:hypothetical protein
VGPEGVEHHADAHTGLGACRQGLGELGTDAAAPVDEREEVDGVLSLLDRAEHGGKNLVAVAQDVDAVALRGRYTDDAFKGTPKTHR